MDWYFWLFIDGHPTFIQVSHSVPLCTSYTYLHHMIGENLYCLLIYEFFLSLFVLLQEFIPLSLSVSDSLHLSLGLEELELHTSLTMKVVITVLNTSNKLHQLKVLIRFLQNTTSLGLKEVTISLD